MKKYLSRFVVIVLLLSALSFSSFAISESKTIVDYVYEGLGVFCILFNDGTVYEVFNGGEIGSCQAENVERIQCKNSPVFFKKDGTIALGSPYGWNSLTPMPYELDDKWTDIVLVDAGYDHAVGMKADGTMVSAGNYVDGQCNITDWTDIVDLRVGDKHTVGLKSDGTVVATGNNKYGQCDVSSWVDIISIHVGENHTIDLKSDGSIVAAGEEIKNYVQWDNVVSIFGDCGHPEAITADNSILTDTSNLYADKGEHGIPFDYVFEDIKYIYLGWHCSFIIHNDNTCEFFADYYEKDSYSVAQEKAVFDFIQSGLNGDISTRSEELTEKEDSDEVHQNIIEQNSSNDYSILQKGSKGAEVKKLQERLNELGYSVGIADGDFGNKTKTAIEQFQKDNGLDVTGIADQETQKLLFSNSTGKPENSSSDSSYDALLDAFKAMDINGDGHITEDEIFR